MHSSIPAVKNAIVARLTTALAGVADVHYGDPDKMGPVGVIMGSAKSTKMEYLAGMTQANESYDLELIVSVVGPMQELYPTLVGMAFTVNDLVVASLLSWAAENYGGLAIVIIPQGADDSEGIGDGWHEAAVIQTIHVIARI